MRDEGINGYGKAALVAVELCLSKNINPVMAWRRATLSIFGDSAAQKKSAPKTTFLNLCKYGHVKGINSGDYTNSDVTYNYVKKGIQILDDNKGKNFKAKELWEQVQNKGLLNRYHMDVLLSLWENNLIKKK